MSYRAYLRDCMDRLRMETSSSERMFHPYVAVLRWKLFFKRSTARKLDRSTDLTTIHDWERLHYGKSSPKIVTGKIRLKLRRIQWRSLYKDFWK